MQFRDRFDDMIGVNPRGQSARPVRPPKASGQNRLAPTKPASRPKSKERSTERAGKAGDAGNPAERPSRTGERGRTAERARRDKR